MVCELENFQGISYCHEKLTFFYDETGNCGKFLLREDGVNDPTALNNDFILGGIAYLGDECPADPEQLISDLRIKSSELKFRNIYRSRNFMTFMGSPRVSIYIDWLYSSDLYVHYTTVNNLYYALVDMVDSLWESQPQLAFSFEWILQLKSALYFFCKEHLSETLDLFYKFNYPNIDRERSKDFCCDFCNLIKEYNDESTDSGFLIECFRQMLKYTGKQGTLVFLHDNESNILVEEYYGLYQSRCYTYKYSFHHFDYEKVILAKMQESPMSDNGQLFINYDFIDSKQNKLIQVCDVFVGLMGKLFNFLDTTSFEKIEQIKISGNKAALINFAKIKAVINRSNDYHKMMFQNINDINVIKQRMFKLQILSAAIVL